MAINILAPINSTGYGVAATNITVALNRCGAEPALWPIGAVDASPSHVADLQECVNRTSYYNEYAPSLRIWHQHDLAQHVGHGEKVAFPFFELTRLKQEEVYHLNTQDRILVASEWARSVIQQSGVKRPVHVVPLGVDRSIFNPQPHKGEPWATTRFLNVGKWEYRKGHDILPEAFTRAFSADDDVELVMSCYNPCQPAEYSQGWEQYYRERIPKHQLRLRDGRLPSQAHVANVMWQCDCGVFPSRAEGWNLELLEMMSMDKPVIATNYSAHTEFAAHGNCQLIDVEELEDAHDAIWFDASHPSWNGQPGQWARLGDEQIDKLAFYMKQVHGLKQSNRLNGNLMGVETAKKFSWENTAQQIIKTLL